MARGIKDTQMGRALAGIALLVGVAALVVALAGRGPPGPANDPAETAARLARLERDVAELREELAGAQSRGSIRPATAPEPLDPSQWTLVARKLTVDLKLESREVDIVDAALEECSRSLQRAFQNDDPLWCDRMSKRARREVFRRVAGALPTDKRDHLTKWLESRENARLAAWFLPEKPCGGCGKKRKKGK
jgi:hypothetical protein